MSVTDEIKNRLDIVDIVSESVQLRKTGRSYAGFCPFHTNTRTPAFHVFPETQTWHCFGACAEGGDLFSYVMKKEGWEFKEALAQLARRAGVTLESHKPVDKEKQTADKKRADLLATAADYFHMLLLHAPEAVIARDYVANRGLQEETVATFRIGYALDAWHACRTHFNEMGYTDDDLLEVGLLTMKEEGGRRYDRFRHRLMIPIYDVNGRVVGFGARTLAKDGIPKYLNSPQTSLFDKSHLLYGLDKAKRPIREARQVVIVEGYMDVIQAWQAGFRNVVAQMGTALTEAQLRLLKRYTKRFVLALDADAAGVKATMRSLQVARQTLDREMEIRFDARGLVRYEGRLQADIRVATLPEGKDPDQIIRHHVEEWPRLLAEAKPIVAYVIDAATQDLDLNDAKAKTAVAQQVLPLIKDIVDVVERDHYWQMLARILQIDERALRQVQLSPKHQPATTQSSTIPLPATLDTRSFHKNQPVSIASKTAVALSTNMQEANYLRQCLEYPRVMQHVNRKLAQYHQPIISESDFTRSEDRFLLRHMYQRINQDTVATFEELCDSLDTVLLERVQNLMKLPSTPKSETNRLPDTLVLSVLDWRLKKLKQLIGELKQQFHEPNEKEDNHFLEKLSQLSLVFRSINKAKDAMSASNRRRAEAINV